MDVLSSLRSLLSSFDDVFESNASLNHVFVDPRLRAWRGRIPDGSSRMQRIEGTIAYLSRRNSASGENALLLFLQILREHTDPRDDTHRRLGEVIETLRQAPLYGTRALGEGGDAGYEGAAYGRIAYRSQIDDIIHFYTGHFVGRRPELSVLVDLAAREQGGYLLLEAGAGLGKSALLAALIVAWEEEAWSGPRPSLLYYFIRQQARENTALSCLQALNSQLLALLEVAGGAAPDLASLQAQFRTLWPLAVQQASAARPLLLLIDGLDEMAREEPAIADLLPGQLGPYVHVVVTSRPQPPATELVRLEHPLRRAERLQLFNFSVAEVEELLGRYGAAVTAAAQFAGRIWEVTRGEPLFVRFVSLAVLQQGEAALVALEVQPPSGVEEYFRQQFRQLSHTAETELTWQILGLLVSALGELSPLELADILGVSGQRLEAALAPIRRYLVGTERFTFMHRQLQEVVAAQFSAQQRQEYAAVLLDWGRRYQARGWPAETPLYLLWYYAAHLDAAGRSDELYALINRAWLNAQRAQTRSYRLFAQDVSLAIDRAAREGRVVETARNCVLHALLVTMTGDVPPRLLAVLAGTGQLSRALDDAAMIQNPEQRFEAFYLLLQLLTPEQVEAIGYAIYQQLIDANAQTEEGEAKDRQLLALVDVLIAADVVDEAPPYVAEISDEDLRREAWARQFAARLQTLVHEEGTVAGTQQALRILDTLSDPAAQAAARHQLVTLLLEAGAFERAHAVALRAPLPADRAVLLIFIVAALAQDGKKERALALLDELVTELGQVSHPLTVTSILEMACDAVVDAGLAAAAARIAPLVVRIARSNAPALGPETVPAVDAKVQMLLQATRCLVRQGATARALTLAEEVKQTAAGLELPDDEAAILSRLLIVVAACGDEQGAFALAQRVQQLASDVGIMEVQARILVGLAEAQLEAGQRRQALQTTGKIPVAAMRAEALQPILWQMVQEDATAEAFQEERTLLVTRQEHITCLTTIAEALLFRGDEDRARAVARRVLRLAEALEEDEAKVELWSNIALAMAAQEQPDATRAAARRALAAADAVTDDLGQGFALAKAIPAAVTLQDDQQVALLAGRAMRIAATLASHDSAVSLDYARRIIERTARKSLSGDLNAITADVLLGEVARQLAWYGQWSRALAAIRRMTVPEEIADALRALLLDMSDEPPAASLVAALIDDALVLAYAIADPVMATLARLAIITFLANHRQFARAQREAERIADPAERVVTLNELATTLLAMDERPRALACARHALQAAQTPTDPHQVIMALAGTARVLQEAGASAEALAAARTARARLGDVAAEDQPLLLGELAALSAVLGEPETALQLAHRAYEAAQVLPPAGGQVMALAEAARALAAAGAPEALPVTRRTLAAAFALEDEGAKEAATADMLVLLVQLGATGEAARAVHQIFTATDLDYDQWVTGAFDEAVQQLLQVEKNDAALKLIAAIPGEGLWLRADALCAVSIAQARRGDYRAALATAAQIETPWAELKADAVQAIAGFLMTAPGPSAADQEILAALVDLTHTLVAEPARARAFSAVAGLLAQREQVRQAIPFLLEALTLSRNFSRETVLAVLSSAAYWLARNDQGKTLWRAATEIGKVEAWFSAGPPETISGPLA
jgi:hypothetical protein